MGAGASSKKQEAANSAVPTVNVIMTTPMARTGSGFTDGDDVDPTEHLSSGQAIIHSGPIWKLNGGADPSQMNEWLRRKMWLTDMGGLFYYSRQFDRPVGRSVATLSVRVTDDKVADRYIFELTSMQDDVVALPPTMLAVETKGERDAWVRYLAEAATSAAERGVTGELDPLEPTVGRLPTERRRLSTLSGATTASNVNAATSDAAAAVARLTTGSTQVTGSTPRLQPGVVSSKTLRSNLNASLVEHCKSLQSSGFVMSDLGQRPSSGPNAFLDQTARQALDEASGVSAQRIRRDSQADFASKPQTLVVLDWDDTLFPTTFVRQDCGLDWRRSINEQVKPGATRDELVGSLNKLAAKVDAFVTKACSLGHVVIITLAKRPWVDISMDNFMPQLRALLERHKIEVIYAREKISEDMRLEFAQNVFKANDQEVDFWMRAKANAMVEQISKHYPDRSWKNLLSIGDGEFERIALVTTAEQWFTKEREDAYVVETGLTSEVISKDGHRKRLRTKTVKMLDEPAIEEMIAQLELFRGWLQPLVSRDRGVDVVIEDSENDANLRAMDADVTGRRRENLTWRGLAGLDE